MQLSRRRVTSIASYTILTLMMIFALGPILILLMNSVKSTAEIGRNPIGFPEEVILQNYADAWEQGDYALTIRNSIILTGGTIVVTLSLAGLAGYALARLDLKGAGIITFYFLVGTSVPAQLFMIPLFFMWRGLGLVNTHIGLIIIYCGIFSPFATYLIRSYMVALPEEFIDAAKIDGANNFDVFWHIIRPLSWPGFLTAGLVVGLGVWNEFLFAVTFLSGPEFKPIATSLFAFQARFGRDWGLTSAGSVIMMLPVIVLFLLLQRRFIEGLTQGGLKA
ncbi:MAG: carbohydrate ABC transporter permease [Anaerolineae bacterium]|nr:carbohydrate ABC transporter permease [Anaerolineae bacterium]MCA9892173.1 carbohydrate ABC transporter permease [Anaerolineae bacterium]MCB9460266.1 carbohydrate ABC transporter permease [Anaerolineaceae bacterium]